MLDLATLQKLLHHTEVSRHQMYLRLRNVRKNRKQLTDEHFGTLAAGLESIHPEVEICNLVKEKSEAAELIRKLKKLIKLEGGTPGESK